MEKMNWDVFLSIKLMIIQHQGMPWCLDTIVTQIYDAIAGHYPVMTYMSVYFLFYLKSEIEQVITITFYQW